MEGKLKFEQGEKKEGIKKIAKIFSVLAILGSNSVYAEFIKNYVNDFVNKFKIEVYKKDWYRFDVNEKWETDDKNFKKEKGKFEFFTGGYSGEVKTLWFYKNFKGGSAVEEFPIVFIPQPGKKEDKLEVGFRDVDGKAIHVGEITEKEYKMILGGKGEKVIKVEKKLDPGSKIEYKIVIKKYDDSDNLKVCLVK